MRRNRAGNEDSHKVVDSADLPRGVDVIFVVAVGNGTGVVQLTTTGRSKWPDWSP